MSVSPLTDVSIKVPPEIVSVSVFVSATAVPESEATFLNTITSEPLSVFVKVTVCVPLDNDTDSLKPEPAVNTKLSPVANDWPSICGLPAVAAESNGEPSISHLPFGCPLPGSYAKLNTIEWEPVTFEAALGCLPLLSQVLLLIVWPALALNNLVSNPNPPVVGSVPLLPINTNVSSTCNVDVFNVTVSPWTIKSPVTVKSFPTTTSLGKPIVTVFPLTAVVTSPDVPARVIVSPKLTEFVVPESASNSKDEFDSLLFGIEPANLAAAIEPANILFSTEPAWIVVAKSYVPVFKSVSVTEPPISPVKLIVGSASKLISKFWFVSSQTTATPVSELFENNSLAL